MSGKIQTSIFDFLLPKYKSEKPIRLIELFAGYGSQFLSLKYLGANVESYKIVEWNANSFKAFNDLHFQDKTDYSKDLSKKELAKIIVEKGVSANDKNTIDYKGALRRGEKWLRKTFNNIVATNNLVDITKTTGGELNIVEKDKYNYIMTYSFPCQDLSLAGQGKGMGEGTRSGLLWQVERILSELNERKELPQVLLMENVPMVVSAKYRDDLARWDAHLTSLGYSSYIKNLIATDFLIPQTRNRTFMISILGDYSYQFPQNSLGIRFNLSDFIEEKVDEKYFLSDKLLKTFLAQITGEFPRRKRFLESVMRTNFEDVESTITTRAGDRSTDNFILVPEATEKGYAVAYEGDGVYIDRPHQKRGVVQHGAVPTIKTQGHDIAIVVKDTRNAKEKLADEILKSDILKEFDVINHSYTNKKKKANSRLELVDYIETNDNCAPTLTTRIDTIAIAVTETDDDFEIFLKKNKLRLRKLTPREAFRLMGIKNKDIDNIEGSDATKYKLAGNSIVVQVLMAIFGELLQVDYKTKIKESIKEIK